MKAAAAHGLEVEGIGLGGLGGHCDCSSSTPGPLPDSHVHGVAIVAEANASPSSEELPPSSALTVLAHALGAVAFPAGPAVVADTRPGPRRTTLWWLKNGSARLAGRRFAVAIAFAIPALSGLGLLTCPLVCAFTPCAGCSSAWNAPTRIHDGVSDVDLHAHADYKLDAMVRLASSFISTELHLYRAAEKCAPKAIRDGLLRRALCAILDRLVPGSALYQMVETVGALPALPGNTPALGPRPAEPPDLRGPLHLWLGPRAPPPHQRPARRGHARMTGEAGSGVPR